MKQGIACVLAVTTLVAATGCSSTIASLTVASTKNVDLSAGAKEVGRAQEETDRRTWILFIPFGAAPSIDAAMNKVLERNDGDFLTNVKVDQGGWTLIAFSYGWLSVKGDVWQTGREKALGPVRGVEPPAEAEPTEAEDPAMSEE